MFKKVLLAEDIDSVNTGVVTFLRQHFDFQIDQAKYCDESLLKIKKALQQGNPYDLLISDLSFKRGTLDSRLTSGEELVKEAKEVVPQIKTIIYSVEEKPLKIKKLLEGGVVNGYVVKGINSLFELLKAINKVFDGEAYISPEISHLLREHSIEEIGDYDVHLIRYLAMGYQQDEIVRFFKQEEIHPNSKSAIEKRIGVLKTCFKSKNTAQLVSVAKDLGLI